MFIFVSKLGKLNWAIPDKLLGDTQSSRRLLKVYTHHVYKPFVYRKLSKIVLNVVSDTSCPYFKWFFNFQ